MTWETSVITIPDQANSALQDKLLLPAAEVLREGKLVAFPTETVYGLGANAYLDDAVAEIYRVKGRPQDNPLIVHLVDLKDLDSVAKNIPDEAIALFNHFSPGPLTLILPRADAIPERVSAGLDTVAVRFPEHELARRLLHLAGCPVVAPSANLSGLPSPTRAEHVLRDLEGKIPYIIDGGPCRIGVESTVLDLSGNQAVILRPGLISQESLSEFLGLKVLLSSELASADELPKAPGMKYRHYAPKAKVKLLNNLDRVLASIEINENNSLIAFFISASLLDRTSQIKKLAQQKRILLKVYEGGAEGAARELFAAFRDFDDAGAEIIWVQTEDEEGAGVAYMNRLRKAVGKE